MISSLLRWAESLVLRWLARPLPVVEARRLLFLGDVNPTGGTFTFFRNALTAWRDQGWTVELALREKPLPGLREFCRNEGLPLRPVWSFHALASLLKVGRLVRRRRFALVVTSGGGLDYYDRLFCLRVPVLHFLHTLVHQPLADHDLTLLRRYLRPEHRLVCVSQTALESLRRHAGEVVPPANGRFLYNAVTDRRTLAPTQAAEAGPALVVTIGHVTGYKNPALWVATARAVVARLGRDRVRFVWVGAGDELEARRAECADEPAIEFAGFHRDVDAFLSRATVLFHPSKTESFGLAVAEAMMWGVPSVVSDAGALPELVTGGTGLVFPLAEAAAAVEAVVRVLSLPEAERREWGTRARARYESTFTPEAWARGFRELLR